GVDQATGTFTTSNIPLGSGYFDPVPVDRNAPGATAWPAFYGRDHAESVIDPQTGLKILRGSAPQDQYAQHTGLKVLEAEDMSAGGWSPNGCADATSCLGAGSLVNQAGNPGAVFISNRDPGNLFQAKSYYEAESYDWTTLHLTAWCSGASCASAADQD